VARGGGLMGVVAMAPGVDVKVVNCGDGAAPVSFSGYRRGSEGGWSEGDKAGRVPKKSAGG
jgi:hypothetical protein